MVSRSSTEAECRAMTFACTKIKWLRCLVASLGIIHRQRVRLFCNNQGVLLILANPVFHERSKHIKI